MRKASNYIVKKERIERLNLVGPMNDSKQVMEELFDSGYRLIRTGPYTDPESYPDADIRRFLFIAERVIADEKTVTFIGGFKDGQIVKLKGDLPMRLELWPVKDSEREKRIKTHSFCTSRDSQIYQLENSECPVYRVVAKEL